MGQWQDFCPAGVDVISKRVPVPPQLSHVSAQLSTKWAGEWIMQQRRPKSHTVCARRVFHSFSPVVRMKLWHRIHSPNLDGHSICQHKPPHTHTHTDSHRLTPSHSRLNPAAALWLWAQEDSYVTRTLHLPFMIIHSHESRVKIHIYMYIFSTVLCSIKEMKASVCFIFL